MIFNKDTHIVGKKYEPTNENIQLMISYIEELRFKNDVQMRELILADEQLTTLREKIENYENELECICSVCCDHRDNLNERDE